MQVNGENDSMSTDISIKVGENEETKSLEPQAAVPPEDNREVGVNESHLDTGDIYTCYLCSHIASSKSDIREHKKRMHSKDDDSTIKDEDCIMISDTEEEMDTHSVAGPSQVAMEQMKNMPNAIVLRDFMFKMTANLKGKMNIPKVEELDVVEEDKDEDDGEGVHDDQLESDAAERKQGGKLPLVAGSSVLPMPSPRSPILKRSSRTRSVRKNTEQVEDSVLSPGVQCPNCHKFYKHQGNLFHHLKSCQNNEDSVDESEKVVSPQNHQNSSQVSTAPEVFQCDECSGTFMKKKYLRNHQRRIHKDHEPVQNGNQVPDSEEETASSVSTPLAQEVKKGKKSMKGRNKLWSKRDRNPLANMKKVTLKGKVKSRMKEPSHSVIQATDGRVNLAVQPRRRARRARPSSNINAFPCDLCELKYLSKSSLNLHRRKKHSGPVQSPTTSGRVMTRKRTAASLSPPPSGHEDEENESIVPSKKTRNKSVTGKFKCTYCGKSLVYERSVERHIRTVHRDRDTTEGEGHSALIVPFEDENSSDGLMDCPPFSTTLDPKIPGKEAQSGSNHQRQVHSTASSSFDHLNVSRRSLISSTEQGILNDAKAAVDDSLNETVNNIMDNSSGNVGDDSSLTQNVSKVEKKKKSIVVQLSHSERFLQHMLTHLSATEVEHSNVLNDVDRKFEKLETLICQLEFEGHKEVAAQWTKRSYAIWSQIVAYKTRFGDVNID